MKMITLSDYRGRRVNFEIGEDIKTIIINILSGDEVAHVVYQNGKTKRLDSSEYRTEDFFDCIYTIDSSEIEEFSKIEGSSYDRAEYWGDKKGTK